MSTTTKPNRDFSDLDYIVKQVEHHGITDRGTQWKMYQELITRLDAILECLQTLKATK